MYIILSSGDLPRSKQSAIVTIVDIYKQNKIAAEKEDVKNGNTDKANK